MSIEKPREHAEYVKKYVTSYLLNFDKHLIEEGPHESFNEFLCSYGYKYSSFIMEQIVPFNFFSEKELKILTELENYLHHLLLTHRGVDSWDNLKKDEYLKIKSLSHDYLTLVFDLNSY